MSHEDPISSEEWEYEAPEIQAEEIEQNIQKAIESKPNFDEKFQKVFPAVLERAESIDSAEILPDYSKSNEIYRSNLEQRDVNNTTIEIQSKSYEPPSFETKDEQGSYETINDNYSQSSPEPINSLLGKMTWLEGARRSKMPKTKRLIKNLMPAKTQKTTTQASPVNLAILAGFVGGMISLIVIMLNTL